MDGDGVSHFPYIVITIDHKCLDRKMSYTDFMPNGSNACKQASLKQSVCHPVVSLFTATAHVGDHQSFISGCDIIILLPQPSWQDGLRQGKPVNATEAGFRCQLKLQGVMSAVCKTQGLAGRSVANSHAVLVLVPVHFLPTTCSACSRLPHLRFGQCRLRLTTTRV